MRQWKQLEGELVTARLDPRNHKSGVNCGVYRGLVKSVVKKRKSGRHIITVNLAGGYPLNRWAGPKRRLSEEEVISVQVDGKEVLIQAWLGKLRVPGGIFKAALVCLALASVPGCHAIAGAGMDLSNAASWMQEKIDHGFER